MMLSTSGRGPGRSSCRSLATYSSTGRSTPAEPAQLCSSPLEQGPGAPPNFSQTLRRHYGGYWASCKGIARDVPTMLLAKQFQQKHCTTGSH
eukprot:413846-Amphidinium_carterae.1